MKGTLVITEICDGCDVERPTAYCKRCQQTLCPDCWDGHPTAIGVGDICEQGEPMIEHSWTDAPITDPRERLTMWAKGELEIPLEELAGLKPVLVKLLEQLDCYEDEELNG